VRLTRGSGRLLLPCALAGLALVAAGYRWGDPVAGFAITVFICHVGYEVTTGMLARLMDGLDPRDLDAESAAAAVPGIRSATVRDRWMGQTLLDVETRLDGSLPPAHADQISRQVEDAVARACPCGRLGALGRARLDPCGGCQEQFASAT
jgi:divalent metal cation (Fe/Co/Zn/Cd) transporter